MPGDLTPGVQQRLLGVEDPDEPLAGLQDLQRRLAALVDTNRLCVALLAEQQPGRAQIGKQALARLTEREPRVWPAVAAQPPLSRDQRDQRKLVRPPPLDIGRIAEGAAHHRPAALLRV